MATYCVTYTEDDDWGAKENRFKTRPPADARLEEAQAAGRFARLVRWEDNHPTEIARVNVGARQPRIADCQLFQKKSAYLKCMTDFGSEMPTPTSETQEPPIGNPKVVLAQWQDRLKILVQGVKAWVERAGWHTRTVEKPLNDRTLGRHVVPVLLMEKDTVEIALNPVSPLIPGAEGAVDLYLVPAYDDIASLSFEGGQWVVHYAFSADPVETHSVVEPETLPLSEETILRVLDSLGGPG